MPINPIIAECLEEAARKRGQSTGLVKKIRAWLDGLADGRSQLSDADDSGTRIDTILGAISLPRESSGDQE